MLLCVCWGLTGVSVAVPGNGSQGTATSWKYVQEACNCPITGNASSGEISHNARPVTPCSSRARAAVRARVPVPPVTVTHVLELKMVVQMDMPRDWRGNRRVVPLIFATY
jgi:hypothetical protein